MTILDFEVLNLPCHSYLRAESEKYIKLWKTYKRSGVFWNPGNDINERQKQSND